MTVSNFGLPLALSRHCMTDFVDKLLFAICCTSTMLVSMLTLLERKQRIQYFLRDCFLLKCVKLSLTEHKLTRIQGAISARPLSRRVRQCRLSVSKWIWATYYSISIISKKKNVCFFVNSCLRYVVSYPSSIPSHVAMSFLSLFHPADVILLHTLSMLLPPCEKHVLSAECPCHVVGALSRLQCPCYVAR